jgi:hypothetical protein
MGSLSRASRRRLLRLLALSALIAGVVVTLASAAGPGGWDHLGDGGTPGTDSLDVAAKALAVTPGGVYVGGGFSNAGGLPNADRIAKWNGSSWTAVSSSTAQFPDNTSVDAIAVDDDNVYVGGNFKDAGGNTLADHLAVWDGTSWQPFCDAPTGQPAFGGNVTSLQIIGPTLYVGGEFHDGAGIPSADSLLACDLATGASSATVDPAHPFAGPIYALAADSKGTLYAGGGFTNLGIDDADYVAHRPSGGTWQPMGASGPAVTTFVRGLTAVGTDVYVGTDAINIAGIPQADHVARWNGSAWSALGSGSDGGNGWLPTSASIHALTGVDSHLFVTGSFQNANGDARADYVAWFDGTDWHPVGSNGVGNDGPLNAAGHALALLDRQLYAAGSFTSAGGDTLAQFAASFALPQIIAYPTPTVTPNPNANPMPTPTVTPSPPAAPPAPDVTPPTTSLRRAQISQAKRKATFRFVSGETDSTFSCRLDRKRFRPCTSPKTYKRLEPGKHVFRVKARDRARNLDATPAVKRFKIRKR